MLIKTPDIIYKLYLALYPGLFYHTSYEESIKLIRASIFKSSYDFDDRGSFTLKGKPQTLLEKDVLDSTARACNNIFGDDMYPPCLEEKSNASYMEKTLKAQYLKLIVASQFNRFSSQQVHAQLTFYKFNIGHYGNFLEGEVIHKQLAPDKNTKVPDTLNHTWIIDLQAYYDSVQDLELKSSIALVWNRYLDVKP